METLLSGWVTVTALVLAFAALAFAACAAAMRSPSRTLIVFFLSPPAIGLLAATVLGDISRYLPPHAFSGGFDGLNQIVAASALCSILGGVALSAAVVSVLAWLHAALKPPAKAQSPGA
jgi:apolipoprotein N-acyltransferase